MIINVGSSFHTAGTETAAVVSDRGRPFIVGAERSGVVPDITVLGPYTYLATEVVWGAVALALLVRADALRNAARTIVALYPVAYVWDWYTLEVGVFAIPMRTGVEFLGIPIEEHIFMVVVPALVIGFHEMLRADDGVEGDGDVA